MTRRTTRTDAHQVESTHTQARDENPTGGRKSGITVGRLRAHLNVDSPNFLPAGPSQQRLQHRRDGTNVNNRNAITGDIQVALFDQRVVHEGPAWQPTSFAVPQADVFHCPRWKIFVTIIPRDDRRLKGYSGSGTPNLFASIFLDPYWSVFVAHWLYLSEAQFNELLRATFEGMIAKPGSQRSMAEHIDDLASQSHRYMLSFRNKDNAKCKEIARTIMSVSETYTVLSTTTIRTMTKEKINRFANFPEAYRVLLRRRILSTSVHHSPPPLVHFDGSIQTQRTLDNIKGWIDGELEGVTDKKVLWLHGPSRCGKSSIAYIVAMELHKRRQLDASWLFRRPPFAPMTMQELNQTLLINIIIELGEALGRAFITAIGNHADEQRIAVPFLWDGSMSRQLQRVLLPALKELYSTPKDVPTLFIVIDGIENMDEEARHSFFDMMRCAVNALPFRYILAGNWDRDLARHMWKGRNAIHAVRMDDLPTSTVQAQTSRDIPGSRSNRPTAGVAERPPMPLSLLAHNHPSLVSNCPTD